MGGMWRMECEKGIDVIVIFFMCPMLGVFVCV